MGTNYYAEINKCKECGHPEKRVHIGKASNSWRFLIEIQPDYYDNWTEFMNFIMDKQITDEYGNNVDFFEFVDMIISNKDNKKHYNAFHDDIADFVNYEFC